MATANTDTYRYSHPETCSIVTISHSQRDTNPIETHMPCGHTAREHRYEQSPCRLTHSNAKPDLYRHSHTGTYTSKGAEKQRGMQTGVTHTQKQP